MIPNIQQHKGMGNRFLDAAPAGNMFQAPPFTNDIDGFPHSAKVIFHSTVLVADGTIRTVAVSV